MSKPKATTRPKRSVLDDGLLDEAYGRADEQAEIAAAQTTSNRATERVAREEIDCDPTQIHWRLRPTRRVQVLHALDLAESIAVHGLAQPIAVDSQQVLLAGGHRLFAVLLLRTAPAERAALLERLAEQLAELRPAHQALVQERLASLPHQPDRLVRVNRMAIDARAHPELALEIEIVENEKRRDYTRLEIQALARTLQQAGYSFRRGRRAIGGRAVSGQRMLELITGKSAMSIWRLLQPATPPASRPAAPSVPLARVLAWVETSDAASLRTVQERVAARLAALAGIPTT